MVKNSIIFSDTPCYVRTKGSKTKVRPLVAEADQGSKSLPMEALHQIASASHEMKLTLGLA